MVMGSICITGNTLCDPQISSLSLTFLNDRFVCIGRLVRYKGSISVGKLSLKIKIFIVNFTKINNFVNFYLIQKIYGFGTPLICPTHPEFVSKLVENALKSNKKFSTY